MGGLWFIPVSEMLAMARMLKLSENETERFVEYMQALDDVYVDTINSDGKKDSKTNQSQEETRKQLLQQE
jgi:hypothetical protein